MNDRIKSILKELPLNPGVYIMYNESGRSFSKRTCIYKRCPYRDKGDKGEGQRTRLRKTGVGARERGVERNFFAKNGCIMDFYENKSGRLYSWNPNNRENKRKSTRKKGRT